MTMTMNNKLDKLIGLIREAMEYAEPHEEDGSYLIKLYEDTLTANGFSREDIERLLNKLRHDGLIETKQIFYAPKTTLSTYHPNANVKGQTMPDETYNKPVYYLHINKEKLQSDNADEPLSFDEGMGFVRYQGKKSKIPFKKIEYYVLQALFSHPIGNRVTETKILEAIDPELCKGDSPSMVSDARRRINNRVKEDLGIEELVGYEGTNYWIVSP